MITCIQGVGKANTYVYFALKGDDFDPHIVTDRLGIIPTEQWLTGAPGVFGRPRKFAGWELCTEKGKEYLDVEGLVEEIVGKLFDKIDIINDLKRELVLDSVLEIVLYIDINEEQSTPALGHDLKTIEFLYKTQTRIDVDIYRFNSAEVDDQNGSGEA